MNWKMKLNSEVVHNSRLPWGIEFLNIFLLLEYVIIDKIYKLPIKYWFFFILRFNDCLQLADMRPEENPRWFSVGV